jgi:hypothetical protein
MLDGRGPLAGNQDRNATLPNRGLNRVISRLRAAGGGATRSDFFARQSIPWRAAFAVVTSVLVPLLIGLIHRTPLWADLVIGLAWFTALVSAEIAILVNRQYRMRARETDLWDAYDRIDACLSSMRKSLRTLEAFEGSPEALFRSHFRHQLWNLEAELRHSAESRTVEVSRNHLQRASLVLQEFAGRDPDRIIAVFQASDVAAELSDHLVQEWFGRVYSQTKCGLIREVRRIILLDSEDEERSSLVQLLIAFHTTNNGFKCRLMSTAQFRETVDDYSSQVYLQANDFAVYRGTYAFFGRPLTIGKRTGVWSNAPETVGLMETIFEACWEHPSTRRANPPVGNDEPVTPTELFTAASATYRYDRDRAAGATFPGDSATSDAERSVHTRKGTSNDSEDG